MKVIAPFPAIICVKVALCKSDVLPKTESVHNRYWESQINQKHTMIGEFCFLLVTFPCSNKISDKSNLSEEMLICWDMVHHDAKA